MMKISIDPVVLKKSFSIVKLVKPVLQEYSIKLKDGDLYLSSGDRRRSVTSLIRDVADKSITEEYFLPMDRSVIIDAALDKCDLNITEKGAKITFSSDGVSKSALLKKRNADPKKAPTIDKPWKDGAQIYDAEALSFILRASACSAQVKETKTDEDMRINQVYINGQDGVAVTNARYFASQVRSEHIKTNLCVISSDIPIMVAFLDRIKSVVKVYDLNKKVVVSSEDDSSWITFNKIVGSINKASVLPDYLGSGSVSFTKDMLKECIRWVEAAVDGTQRITLNIDGDHLRFLSNGSEIASTRISNSSVQYKADLPIKILSHFVETLMDVPLTLSVLDINLKNIVAIKQSSDYGHVTHYIKEMR